MRDLAWAETPDLGPFGQAALALYRLGLAVVPCPSDNGKSVQGAVKGHGKWSRRPPVAWVETMITKWPTANIGIITSLSNVTIVDPDDPALVEPMLRRFGDTPLITGTPSGGAHLWYRHSGEASSNLRLTEGVAVDIKGRGGSVIVVPPSVRPEGPHAGKPYRFIRGSWDDLERLPPMRANGLRSKARRPSAHHPPPRSGAVAEAVPVRIVKDGHRNTTLFKLALREAPRASSEDALLRSMRGVVAEHFQTGGSDPFTAAEVEKTVASAWRVQEEGRNWVGQEPRVMATAREVEAIAQDPHGSDAMLLLMKLRLVHWQHDTFAVPPKTLAAAPAAPMKIAGWGPQRYRNALGTLMKLDLLEIVHEGGDAPGDARLFRFVGTLPARVQKLDTI